MIVILTNQKQEGVAWCEATSLFVNTKHTPVKKACTLLSYKDGIMQKKISGGKYFMNDNYLIRGLHHIGLVTDDLEHCTNFYIENLDFRMIYKMDLGHVQCWFIENNGLVLEFVSRGARHGEGALYHIAIEVCGIEGLVEELKGKGIIPEDAKIGCNPDFFPSGIKNIFFDGPAGETLELFELAQ